MPSLISWSWVASRWYLSVSLFAAAIVWRMNLRSRIATFRGEMIVYASATSFMLLSLLFFLYAPLPRVYYPEI